jgi:hypothetical protein
MIAAGTLAVQGSFLMVLVVGGLRVADRSASLADLVAFLLYMTYLLIPVGTARRALGAIRRGRSALQHVNEVLSLPLEPAVARISRSPARGRAGSSADAGQLSPALEFAMSGLPTTRGVRCCVVSRSRFRAVAGSYWSGPTGPGSRACSPWSSGLAGAAWNAYGRTSLRGAGCAGERDRESARTGQSLGRSGPAPRRARPGSPRSGPRTG